MNSKDSIATPTVAEDERIFRVLCARWDKWDAARWRHVYHPWANHRHTREFVGEQIATTSAAIQEIEDRRGEFWARVQYELIYGGPALEPLEIFVSHSWTDGMRRPSESL